MSPGTGKVCVVCGKDCAGSPRVKDPHGRYYCKPCYEDALERKKKDAGAVGAFHEPSHESPVDQFDLGEPEMPDFEKPLFDDDDAFGVDQPVAAGTGRACPQCKAQLDPGAILCVNCGYNLKEGKAIKPQIIESAAEAPAGSTTKWPIVIGIFSLLFAAFGALQYGAGLVSALGESVDQAGIVAWVSGVMMSSLMVVLAIGLGVAAVLIIRRQKAGAVWIRWWAWAKASVSLLLTCLGLLVIPLLLDSSDEETLLPPEFAAIGASLFALILFVFLLWMLFWPVFILLWFRLAAIKEEVEQWS